MAGLFENNPVNTSPTSASDKNDRPKKHFRHNPTSQSLIKYAFDKCLRFTICLYLQRWPKWKVLQLGNIWVVACSKSEWKTMIPLAQTDYKFFGQNY